MSNALLVLTGCIVAACAFAEAEEAVPVDSVRSRYALLEIDHVEAIRGSELLYVRSIRESEDYANAAGDGAKVVTYVNGIYTRQGDGWKPVWEESGVDESGFGRCQRGTAIPQDGGFNDCEPSVAYLDLLAGGEHEFCVRSDWSAYRGTRSTLRCFDVSRPTKPILALDSGWVMGIRRDGKSLQIEVNAWPRAGNELMEFAFDGASHAFELESARGEAPDR